MSPLRGIGGWIEARTGLGAGVRKFLHERVPPRLPWAYTLGSVVLALFAVQAATGIFLAVYYAPTPDHAHSSIRFIERSIAGGSWLRGIHHWGASFIVVIAVLHMARSFLYGSYRRPRELTWILGALLLFLVLAFGLTGYLLPWDQRAYWATRVTLGIAGSVPFAGPFLSGIGSGGGRLGALTLNRFYAIHVLMLPALTAAIVLAHVWLVRRHGSTGPPSYKGEAHRDGMPFHPSQSARDAVAMALVFAILVAMAITRPAPLAAPADPTDATFVPRPEWYFLGLFQLLKFFPGRLEVIGTVVIPTMVAALLFAVPFLDRARSRDYAARRGILAVGGLLGAGVIILTGLGAMDRAGNHGVEWNSRDRIPFPAVAGPMIMAKRDCESCHQPDGTGTGPALTGGPRSRDAVWARAHMSDPDYVAPGTRDPDNPIAPSQASMVLAYLDELGSGPVRASSEVQRAEIRLMMSQGCISCHTIDGGGGTMGPNLAGVARRRTKQWIIDYLPAPQAVNPRARMRAFPDLTLAQRDSIASYLALMK